MLDDVSMHTSLDAAKGCPAFFRIIPHGGPLEELK